MGSEKTFAVVLSGAGVFDGSEIHEAVMTLYAIKKHGASYKIFAPDIYQHHVINHITGEEMPEQRNVLVESARIARGSIIPLSNYDPTTVDGIIFPGGFGAAKNLSTFAFDGSDCKVNHEVERAIRLTHDMHKPIGALCIAPVVVARVLGDVQLTIGNDKGTASALEEMGAHHAAADHGEVVVDKGNLVFTTPCYMLDATIVNIADGANAIVAEMLKYMG